ncbi:hypothetical protein [Simplicispira piscis]
MRGFQSPAKSPAKARGFRPAMTAALAQAQNQAPDSVHAMVKPGEFVLPPDTVNAMGGAQALQGVVNATHTPARGFAPKAKPEEPRQFFANGGLVEDENPKRPNSFGDAAAAARDAGVTQVGGLANDGGASANRIAQVPAPIGTQPGRTPEPAAQPATGPGATSAVRGFAPAGIAAQPAAEDRAGAGAGRGFVNPSSAAPQERGIVGAKPGTPEASQVMAGVYRSGNSYSDSAQGAVDGATPRGLPSAQNMAAAYGLAARQQQESMGRIEARGFAPGGFAPQAVQAPQVLHSGNSWQARNDLRNAMVSATSITNDGGKWDKHGKGVVSPERAYAMELAKTDAALRGAQPGVDAAAMRENAGIQREGMQQAGETQRSRLQQALADIRERRTAQHQDNQDGIARQRLAIDAARLSRDGAPSGYRPKADGTGLEYIPGGPADPNTPKGRNNLNDTQAKALQFGARMQQSGQNLDALANSGVTRPGDIKSAADVVGLGGVMNWTQSPKQQQVEQSQRDFVNAVLRRESGAAISNSEFDNARRQYFPQIGDDDKVIEQKRRNRELATRGVLAEVPDSEKRVQQVTAAGQPTQQPQRAVSRTGTINGRKVVQYSDGSISYAD